MAVVGPDGTPTESGAKILLAIQAGYLSPEDIAKYSSLALSIVRSGLHDMERARLVRRNGDFYELDEKGSDILR
jgi:hypothetical protein